MLHRLTHTRRPVPCERWVHLHPAAPALRVATLARNIDVVLWVTIREMPSQPVLRRGLALATEDGADIKSGRKGVFRPIGPLCRCVCNLSPGRKDIPGVLIPSSPPPLDLVLIKVKVRPPPRGGGSTRHFYSSLFASFETYSFVIHPSDIVLKESTTS